MGWEARILVERFLLNGAWFFLCLLQSVKLSGVVKLRMEILHFWASTMIFVLNSFVLLDLRFFIDF
jgi:hypothetical protein